MSFSIGRSPRKFGFQRFDRGESDGAAGRGTGCEEGHNAMERPANSAVWAWQGTENTALALQSADSRPIAGSVDRRGIPGFEIQHRLESIGFAWLAVRIRKTGDG